MTEPFKASAEASTWPRAAVGWLALLMLWHALPYAWATVTLDTARDLHAARQIAAGEWLGRGPIFNGLFNLGPIWFYLLAPIWAITKSAAWTLLWAGLLASLKFPLAYRMGRAVEGHELGLMFALVLAMPSWSALGAVFPTHTAMVECAVLAQLLLMWRLSHGAPSRYWLALGLAAGLALHAHPSAVFVLILLPLVLWQRFRRFSFWRECAGLLGAIVLGLLPLLPMLWVEAREGWPSAQRTTAFAAESGSSFAIFQVFKLLRGTLWFGPIDALSMATNFSWVRGLLWIPLLLLIAGLVARLRGLTSSTTPAPTRIGSVVLVLMTIIVIALMLVAARSYAPYYMVLVLLPLAAAVAAWILRALPAQYLLRWLLLIPVLAGSWVLIGSADRGLASINVARLSNVRSDETNRIEAALLSAWELDALRRNLCDHPGPLVLHGYLAALFDGALMAEQAANCAAGASLQFSGSAAANAQHWLGLPPLMAQQLGISSGSHWRDTIKQQVQPLWPLQPLSPADPLHYPHHAASGALLADQIWRVRSESANVLITTDLLFPYRVNRVEHVLANGQPARRIAEMNITQVWLCSDCADGAIDWEVQGRSNDAQTLDIVAISTAPSRLPAE